MKNKFGILWVTVSRILSFGYLIALMLIGSACRNQLPTDPLEHFNEPETLAVSNRIDLEEYGIFRPGRMLNKDSICYIRDKQSDLPLKAFNIHTKKVYKGIRRGSGPRDINLVGNIMLYRNEAVVYDLGNGKFSEILFSESDSTIYLNEYRKFSMRDRIFIPEYIGENIVSSGFFQTSWINYYNKEDSLLSTLPFPEFTETEHFSAIEKTIIYSGTQFAVKPDLTKVAYATQQAGVFAIAEVRQDSLIETVRRCYHPASVTHYKNQRQPIAYNTDNKVGFCEIVCDNNYIYALYSGRTHQETPNMHHHCNHLLVYNWQGNPVKRFYLEKALFAMGYNEKRQVIYGITYDPEGCLVEYAL
jgi:hypothetical protein